MADERKYYVMCADNCKFEGMTKEQIYAAIAEATGKTAGDVNGAFITMLKELNAGNDFKIWVGTQQQFNEQVANIPAKTFCYIVDDTTADDINAAIEELQEIVETIEKAVGNNKKEFDALKLEYQTTKTALEKKYAEIKAELNGDILYEGDAALSFDISNLLDYKQYKRYVAYCQDITNVTKVITFNVIEITAGSGVASGMYTINAYASKYTAEKVTDFADAHETYVLNFTVQQHIAPPPETTTAMISIISVGEDFATDARSVYKLIGFKN